MEENLDNGKAEDEEIIEPTEVTEETAEPTEATYPAETEGELETEPVQETVVEEESTEWNGQVLNAWLGTVQGPSGRETYYNLPMSGVISIMRDLGYSEEEYPYWVRRDGCKMLGDYIMVAANLQLRPRGTIVETSLGIGLVCDTGGFAQYNEYQIDVAVDW